MEGCGGSGDTSILLRRPDDVIGTHRDKPALFPLAKRSRQGILVLLIPLGASEDFGAGVVRRQEGFELKFGDGDISGGRERGKRSNETQLAAIGAEPTGYGKTQVIRSRVYVRDIGLQLRDEFVESWVRAPQRLGTETLDNVATPLSQIDDAIGKPTRVKREPQQVDRRFKKVVGRTLDQQANGSIGGNQLSVGSNNDSRIR